MDFRVKKLILEEGMKNIAETEGVKLEMSFDSFTKQVTVDFMYGRGGLHKETSYDCVEREDADIFKTIEDTRREVQAMKNPTTISFMNGINGGIFHPVSLDAIARAKEGINARYGYFSKSSNLPKIKNVIFNYPATIVFWADGDKTVVKCQNGDMFDEEKGLAMAIVKKAYGGKGNYCEIFKPWIEKYRKTYIEEYVAMLMKESVEFYDAACKTSADDIQDILDGKVDPLMIKVDEDEPKTVKKHCLTCKHEDVGCLHEPCQECLTSSLDNSKWEPKEEKKCKSDPVDIKCEDCAYYEYSYSLEPCSSCSKISGKPFWRPKK